LKKISIFLTILLITLLFSIPVGAISTSASSAILINADTLSVLYAKNADEKRSMASTTKIMTALLLSEANTPQKTVTVTKEMAYVEGTNMGLKVGDTVTYNALLYGLLLSSGNDAANTVALSLSKSFSDFAVLMNKRAEQIGMKNTSFVTPSGLDDENHYSTAFDMALLAATALKNPQFAKAAATKEITIDIDNKGTMRTFSNHNKMLRLYDGAIGVKTGFTKKSGRCLVSAAKKDNVTLIAVTLNAPNDWEDHKKMLDYGFENSTSIEFEPQIPEGVYCVATNEYLPIKTSKLLYGKSFDDDIVYKISLPNFVYGIQNDEVVGEVSAYCGNTLVATSQIIVEESRKNYDKIFFVSFYNSLLKLIRSI